MFYLDERYASIIGYQGILRFLPEFGNFRRSLREYVKKERVYQDMNGVITTYPGLDDLPYNIAGLIDGTIDPISRRGENLLPKNVLNLMQTQNFM